MIHCSFQGTVSNKWRAWVDRHCILDPGLCIKNMWVFFVDHCFLFLVIWKIEDVVNSTENHLHNAYVLASETNVQLRQSRNISGNLIPNSLPHKSKEELPPYSLLFLWFLLTIYQLPTAVKKIRSLIRIGDSHAAT